MSDGEVLPPSAPFTRGSKARASLPTGRSSGHTKERPVGVLYLQYGEDTKQVRMPAEISSEDALRALFVAAFPHQLTMNMLQSPNMAVYIKDPNRNVYYNLEDVRNITAHSCLKVYHKDPTHVFSRHARPASTEGRISKEVLYGSHSPVHTLSSSSRSTLHSLQGSMSPPMVRSMPSSPSRKAYGGGGARGRGGGLVDPGNATLPPGSGRSSALCTSSSAILERRDVKPDEDVGSSKALVVRGEGGSPYPDSYCSSLQDGGGRLSICSSQCSAPPSLAADMVDAGVLGIPGGLQQYRASVKPLMGYGESVDHQTCSLHRQKSRRYADSQFPPLGTKTPPPSPHRVGEVKMMDGQIIGGVGLVSSDRMSPVRRSFRRDSNGATVEIVNRSRGSGSSSSASSVFVDSPLGQPERLFQGHGTTSNVQSERMKAMEEQIASLAGLVHHALSIGPEAAAVKDAISENVGRTLLSSRHGVSSEPQDPDSYSPSPLALPAPPPGGGLQQRLVSAKRSVSELKGQLSQLRRLQLSNQKSVSSMLRMAGQELVVLMCERLAQAEDATCKQRAEMEEERIQYLTAEERILTQLSELEAYVEHLLRTSGSCSQQPSITLRDVEEGAVNLRRVGEALAVLKGEFPELQVKMRSVLRLEVEAVRFLKEEPHKMDSMLKRVKALTDALSSLRRCVSESAPPARPAQAEPGKVLETGQQSPQSSPKPQPRSSVRTPLSGSQAEVGSASPIMARRMKSTAPSVVQPSHHYPSPPLTPTHGRDSPTVAKVSPRSREGSPALHRRPGPQTFDGPDRSAVTPARESHRHQTAITERQTPEGRLSTESSTSQAKQPTSSDSSQTQAPNTSTDLDQVLQEVQANLMKSIPDLDVSGVREGSSDSASGQRTSTATKSEPDPPLDLTLQAASVLLVATMEPPPSAAPSAASASPIPERSRPQVEKPRRSSMDREMKQGSDKANKSPPPPPPRRLHAVGSGVTIGRPGGAIFTSRTEPAGAQDEDRQKDPPLVPQPKPPRQPPEVKPKPQICPQALLAASTFSPAPTSAQREEEEEEEEEEYRFMRELQVTTQLLHMNHSSGGNEQKAKGKAGTSPATPSANQNPPHLTACDFLSAPPPFTNGCPVRVSPAAALDERRKELLSAQGAAEEEVEIHTPGEEVEVHTPGGEVEVHTPGGEVEVHTTGGEVTMPTQKHLPSSAPNQIREEEVGLVFSPSAEKKVKFTTIVTLHKENLQGAFTRPQQTEEKAVQEAPAEKKSNVTVVVTLQKENAPDVEQPSALEQNWSTRSDQVLKRVPHPPSSTFSPSNKLQTQEATGQDSTEQPLYTEEGGTLSPSACDDEGPPPPPPQIGKFSHRLSKTRIRKEEDRAKPDGSDAQTGFGDGTGEGHENLGFDDNDEFGSKPIIVILNEPMDIQSAYKRLSTIFESEEDLDGILSPESIVHEEETKQEDEERGVRRFCITEISTSFGNGQNSAQRPRTCDTSVPEEQEKPDPLQKTETKRKFKFKFPKNKLAAISQAIRTGANKSGKKTLEVVVYEEEEEMGPDSRTVKDTKKQTKESKSVETNSTKAFSVDRSKVCDRDMKVSPSKPQTRVQELRKNTFDSINSLEESIKELEISVDSITAPSPPSTLSPPPQSPGSPFDPTDRVQNKGKVRRDRERSPSKRPATQITKGQTPPQSKRSKPQREHDSRKSSAKKQTSSSSSTSSAPRSHAKPRQASSSGSPEKAANGQQPVAKKQASQPRVVAIPR